MIKLTYSQIAPILRACVIPEDPAQPKPNLEVAAKLLVEWTETGLKAEGQRPALTPSRVIQKLRDALRELRDRSFTEERTEPSRSYQLLQFVYYLLCEPPTSTAVILREFELTSSELQRMLDNSFSGPDIQVVINKVGSLLLDLCGQPEKPEQKIPDPPLRSFEDLVYLGGLRHALTRLYNSQPPKIAQAQYIPPLLKKLRERAQTKQGGRVLLVAPTNGGKNGIILTASLGTLVWDQGPVVVLQPYRAQISESLRTWKESISGTPVHRELRDEIRNLSVAGSSSTITEHDADIIRKRIDLVAIIPEKLAVLSRNQPLPGFCGLLICDEIAQILSQERGPKLEIVLTLAKVAQLPIVAVGAGLSDLAARRVATWLADLPPDSDPRATSCLLFDPSLQRDPPIEYRLIRIDGRQRFWHPGKKVLDPDPPDVPAFPEDQQDAVVELVIRELSADPGRQILIFLENRDRLAKLAEEIARTIRTNKDNLESNLSAQAADAANTPLADIWLGGSMPIGINVRDVLSARVGIHTRDVPSTNLERIEAAFRAGRLRVLCATTTVEAGINLPVDTVIQVGLLDHDGRRLAQRALEQRLGRSGRTLPGRNSPGRGIIFVPDAKQSIERVIEERILRPDPMMESGMDPAYIALLILSYLGSEGKPTQELFRVLAASYWGYGKDAHTISTALQTAVAELRRLHLISSVHAQDTGLPADQQWISTELGQALSAALLLPHDAEALDRTLRVALSEADARTWMPEVIFAACQVPSLLNSDKRPREADVIVRPPLSLRGVMSSWIHMSADRRYLSFGFPKLPKMIAGSFLIAALERIRKGVSRTGEQQALLRTYLAWLWSTGSSVDVPTQLQGLTEHVVQQDLAYYLTHVLRAVSWLANLRGNFIIGLRVKELARAVDIGVPANAASFVLACGEHVRRRDVAKVTDGNFDSLLNQLDPPIVEELRLRITKSRQRRHDRELRALVSVGAAGSRDEAVRFDRLDSAADVIERLSRIWDASQGPCVVLDRGRAKLGNLEIRFLPAINSSKDISGTTLLISGSRLPPDVVNSRSEFSCSVLGTEEFVVLAKELAGREGANQSLLVGVLSRLHRVCYRDLIEHIAGEISGGWLPGSVDEPSPTVASRREAWSDIISSEIRLASLAAPLFESSNLVASSSTGAVTTIATEHNATPVLSGAVLHVKAWASLLRASINSSIEARQLAAANYDLPIVRDKLQRLRERFERMVEIEASLTNDFPESSLPPLIEEINAIGSQELGPQWRIE